MDYKRLIGNIPIEIIQGDSYTYSVSFKRNELTSKISKLVFTCNALKIEEDMIQGIDYETGKVEYSYTFDTTNYDVMDTTYDITIHFNSGEKLSQTGIMLGILPKRNKEKETS